MEENNCFYIGSTGFRKSADMYSLLDSDSISEYNFNNLKTNDILYIKTDAIYNFSKILDTIDKKFILVTGCSDYTIPYDIFHDYNEFISFIENKKIIKWFVQNCVYKHDKIINLPIGLDYHTLNKEEMWWGDKKYPIQQECDLIDIKNISKPFYERNILIYSNCHFLTHTKFGNDRINAINTIPKELINIENTRIKRNMTWKNQINYAFVLSPHGNGLDCHRTWESLVLGCIPIVKSSPIDMLYQDLPVLIINDWKEINKQLLIDTITIFKNKKFNFEKLTLKYWLEKMKSHKN